MPTIASVPQRRAVAVARPAPACAVVPQRAAAPASAVVDIAELIVTVAETVAIPQPTPATTWTLAHKLNRYPSVTIVDTAGDLCAADIAYVSASTIVITFGAPTAGTAYLN